MSLHIKPCRHRLFSLFARYTAIIGSKVAKLVCCLWDFVFNRHLIRTTQFARRHRLYIFILLLTLFAAEVWVCWTVPTYQMVVNRKQALEIQQRLEDIAPASRTILEQKQEIERLKKENERLITLKNSVGGGATSYYSAKTPQGACPSIELAYPTASRSVIGGFSSKHTGVDFSAGHEPVYASYTGVISTVLYGGWNGGYGRAVFIDLPDTGWQLRYAHLSELKVRVGQIVKAGQVVGIAGSTGNSSAVHLHFSLLCSGKEIDPLSYLR